MAYQSKDGVDHSKSYWKVSSIQINTTFKTATIQFLGFKDQAARDAGKQSVGIKTYSIQSDSYDLYYSPEILATKDPMQSSYQLATSTQEKSGVSFFDGAAIV